MTAPIRILSQPRDATRIISGRTDQNLENPQVMLRISQDGGLSFGNEHWAPVGKIGQTQWRVLYRRLGAARDPVFELSYNVELTVVHELLHCYFNRDALKKAQFEITVEALAKAFIGI